MTGLGRSSLAPVLIPRLTPSLVSIRAYGAQLPVASESLKRINHYSRMSKTSYNLNRWIAVRTDLLGATFTAGLASYLFLKGEKSAAVIGFSLTMSLDFCNMILYLVRCWNDLEVQSNGYVTIFLMCLHLTMPFSVERIQAYLDIEHEPKGTPDGLPPAAWPTSGKLEVENLTARYSPVRNVGAYTPYILSKVPEWTCGLTRPFFYRQARRTRWNW